MNIFSLPAALLPIRNASLAQTNTAPRAGAQAGRWLAYGLSLAMVMLFFVGSVKAQVNFASAVNYTTPDGTIGGDVTKGDFNGDGNLDVATANRGANNISVFLGNGDGTFATGVNYATGSAWQIISTDLNADSKLDLVVVIYTNYVGVLLGVGDGTFGAITTTALPTTDSDPRNLLAGDFNNDGNIDIVTGNAYASQATMLLGNGLGGFSSLTNISLGGGNGNRRPASGDLDGDGDLDLVYGLTGNPVISVRLGVGNGTFTVGANYLNDNSAISAISLNDLNTDGKLDLITANSNKIQVFLGNGDGTFGTVTNYTTGAVPYGLTVADFDGDGKRDVAYTDGTGSIKVRLGDGTGVLGSANSFNTTGPLAVIHGDFTGDGKIDLVARSGNAFGFLLNASPSLTVSTTTLSGFLATVPTASASQSFTVASVGLGADASVALNNTNFELSTDNISFSPTLTLTQSGGVLVGQPVTVYVRLKSGLGLSTKTATLTVSSVGVGSKTVTLSGTVNGNNALNFDGSDDYVSLPGTFGGPTWTEMTLEAWVNVSATSADLQAIMSPADLTFAHFQLFNAGNNVAFTNTGSVLLPIIPQTPLSQWRHVAMVIKSGDSRLYVDGVQQGTAVTTTFGNILASSSVSIGRAASGSRHLNGQLDEVRIWNVARTCDQINSTMNRELLGTESNLVGYYNFNQGIASGNNTGLTTLTDLAGTADNGTLTNFATLTGATSNWVDGTGNGVTGTTPQTPAEINVTVGASGSTKDVGGYTTGSTNDFTYTIQNTGGMSLALTGSTRVNVSGTGFTVLTQPSAATIAAGGSLTFVVRFTPVAGTNTAAFTIASTDCDEGMYTFTLTGRGITATPSAVRGNMMSFSGSNQSILTSNVLLTATSNVALECWVKVNSYPASGNFSGIIYNGRTGFNGYGLYIDPSGKINCIFGLINLNITAYTIPLNTWVHVALVNTGTTNWVFYADGVAQHTFTGGPNTPTGKFSIGAGYNGSDPGLEFLNGSIDEVRVWNTTRTRDQIRENMHNTLSGSESGLVAYYQFNEASGNATDAISGTNGTLYNTPTRSASTVSVAKGAVAATRLVIPAGPSTQTFGNMAIRFTAMSAPAAGDEFVIAQLEELPYNNVSSVTSTVTNYWTVRQFGTQTFTYDQVTFTIPSSHVISAADVATPANLTLYKRTTNSGTSSWGSAIGTGSSANNTTKSIVYTLSPAQTSFSEFVPASTTSILFPVEWLSFEATPADNAVVLDWTTGSEQNNAFFMAERSEDGRTFVDLAEIAAAGNSSSATAYTYTDATLPEGRSQLHYRIRQTDMDGSTSHSEIRTVTLDRTNGLAVYPNPATSQLTVRVPEGIYTVALADATGRTLRTATTNGQATTLNIDLSNLAAGVYLLRAGTATVRVVKE